MGNHKWRNVWAEWFQNKLKEWSLDFFTSQSLFLCSLYVHKDIELQELCLLISKDDIYDWSSTVFS